MDYVVVIEKAENGSYSAYVPDFPGCVTRGETEEEAKKLIAEAVELHIESLRRHGGPVPEPSATTHTIQAA
jgi:predicted RNase H-like HicB family nuclease